MTTRTVTRLFETEAAAVAAVAALEAAGIATDDISIIIRDHDANSDTRAAGTTAVRDRAIASEAGTGAAIGAVLGGGGGLLAGIGAVAIPGIGPVIAVGWLVATLAGVGIGAAVGGSAGGLMGALTNAGVPAADAHAYAEGVRRGGSLVTVRVAACHIEAVEQILDDHTIVDSDAVTGQIARR